MHEFTEAVVKAREHVRERVRERYGIDVAPETLVKFIERGDASLAAFGSLGTGRLIYAVPVSGKLVNCIYAPRPGKPGIIVTVLPPELSWEKKRAWRKAREEKAGAAKKELYRGHRRQFSEDDENDF